MSVLQLRSIPIVLSLGWLALAAAGCGSRNIYRNAQFKNPPLERGYVHMSRDEAPDAGQEPVEFGSSLATKSSVFIASETKGLEAFERASFNRKWGVKLKNGVSSEPVIDSSTGTETIYFGANDGNFYAVDTEFGRVLWKYETKVPVYARPTIANKRVYLTASDDVVYCLDQASGKWLWHYKRGGSFITTVHGNSTPAVEAGLVHVGFSDGYLVTLNAADGNLQWEQKIHKGTKFTDVDAMPLLDGNRIYVPSYDGELYALDRLKGKVLWHIDVGGSKKVQMDDKTLFLASSNGNVYALNKDTGRINWKFELDEGTPTNLLQHENYLAFGSSRQYFYVIHKGDGSLAYRYNVGMRSGFNSTPMQSGKEIFVLSNFGNLYVFRWANANSRNARTN